MGNPPAYQYYAADFDEDTASWSNEEVGIYQRLLNYSWINGWTSNEGLPDDPKRLATIARCSYKKFQKRWEIISKKFSRNGSGFLVNRRMEEGREKLLKYIESQRESGKRGAEKRWEKDGDPIADPNSKPIDEPNGEKMALPSSSSLLSSKEDTFKSNFSFPTDEDINECAIPKVKEYINQVSDILYKENIFPEAPSFKNTMLKKKRNPRAILHTLIRCYLKKSFEAPGPWAYCETIMQVEDSNFNEREYQKTAISDND